MLFLKKVLNLILGTFEGVGAALATYFVPVLAMRFVPVLDVVLTDVETDFEYILGCELPVWATPSV